MDKEKVNRELRVLNRKFSLGEYDDSWSKVERYLFIEIYNVIKTFYIAESDSNIIKFDGGYITARIPVESLSKRFFKTHNRSSQLFEVSRSLSKKQINLIRPEEESGQLRFDFLTMFPRITYDSKSDKKHLYVEIHSAVYEEMVPIESYAQLDLKLLCEFTSGNTIRLYEIFKSNSFRRSFEISFENLRKYMGFYHTDSYQEWRYFNNQVLKPAVNDINKHKDQDIEVGYKKKRGCSQIAFEVVTNVKQLHKPLKVLSLNQKIDDRNLNMIQNKYIDTVITNQNSKIIITNTHELKDWIITDLIMQQRKQDDGFNFKFSMNAISKQIANAQYTKPYAHKYITSEKTFNDEIYDDILKMERNCEIKEIREKYTDEEIKAHRFNYILEMP